MPADDEFFTPEDIDEQIDFLSQKQNQSYQTNIPAARIVSHLQQFYRKRRDQKHIEPLERAWERIVEKHQLTQQISQEKGHLISMQDFRKERDNTGHSPGPHRSPTTPKRRSLIQRFSILAAVVFLSILIGGMVLVLNASKHVTPGVTPTAQLGSGGTPRPTPPHPITGGKCSLDTHKTSPQKSHTSVPGLYIFGFYEPGSNLLYRYDPQTKQVVWSKKFCSMFESDGPIEQNGVLYFMGVDVTHESGSGMVSYLYALNETDGSVIWGVQFPTRVMPFPKNLGEASPIDLGAIQMPTIVNGIVYVMQNSGLAYAFDAATGSQLWKFDSGQVGWTAEGGMLFPSSIQVVNDTAYFTIVNRIVALNAQTGSRLWVKTLSNTQEEINSTPAITNDTIYITTQLPSRIAMGSPRSAIYALDAQTGIQKWADKDIRGDLSDPYIAGDKVHAIANNTWYTLNPVDGSIEGRKALPKPEGLWSITLNDTFYLIDDTTLDAMSADGTILWSVPTTGKYPFIRDIKNGIIYVDARGSGVYAYRASDGKFLWHYGGYHMQPDAWSAITVVP